MERPWLILGRALRVVQAQAQAAGHGAAAAVHAGAEAQHAVVGLQAQLEQRVTEVDVEETAAEAAQVEHAAAEPDFTISVKPPPLVTLLTTGISHPNPPAKPDKNPYILASGPFCLLAQFSAEPPRDATKFYYFNPPVSHLVVVRHFRYGADGRIAACAELVPDRGDDLPKLMFRDVESVGLLCDDDDRSYLIAELKITTDTDSPHNAALLCYRSILGAWSRNELDAPLPPEVDGERNRKWVPHGAVALDSKLIWFDLSWGLLSLDFNLQKSELRLEFSSLPPDRDLGPEEATPDIYSRRCIAVSGNKVRYVEIVVPDGEAPTVSMWCRRRQAGVNGWEWALDYSVSFDDIWSDDSYVVTGLRRNTPKLACVSPVDSNVLYFSLQQRLIGVNVPEHRVLHSEPTGRALGFTNSRHFLTWNLHPGGDNNIGHVAPGEPGPQPGDGMEGVNEEQSAGIEPPH